MNRIEMELDEVFSLYIRKRGSVNGFNRCITCNRMLPVEQLHCGHLFSRRNLSTRWDERNAFPQCPKCNCFYHGKPKVYEMMVRERIGDDVYEELRRLSRQTVKLSDEDIRELLDYYKEKLNGINKI